MEINTFIYDTQVEKLLKALDGEARKIDLAKYGLPLHSNLSRIVYHWLHVNNKKYKRVEK